MKLHLILAGLLTAAPLAIQARDSDTVDMIVTNRGKVYERCRILQVDPDGVMFRHKHGAAKILFSEMPPEMQIKLGYDRAKEDAYVKAQTEAKRARELAMWEFRKEVAKLQARAQQVEAARLHLEAAQYEASAMNYGYGCGYDSGLVGSWYNDFGHGYGYGNGYGYGQHGYGGHGPGDRWGWNDGIRRRYWPDGRETTLIPVPEGAPIRFRSVRPYYYNPRPRQVPFGVPSMGPATPSMSPRTGNPGSIFPSR